MSAPPAQSGLDRNVRLYPWYVMSFHVYFWMPVFVLYFLQHMWVSSDPYGEASCRAMETGPTVLICDDCL